MFYLMESCCEENRWLFRRNAYAHPPTEIRVVIILSAFALFPASCVNDDECVPRRCGFADGSGWGPGQLRDLSRARTPAGDEDKPDRKAEEDGFGVPDATVSAFWDGTPFAKSFPWNSCRGNTNFLISGLASR